MSTPHSHTGNPLPTVSWYRNNRKIIPERIIVRQTDTGTEVKPAASLLYNINKSFSELNSSKNYSDLKSSGGGKQGETILESAVNKSVLGLILIESPSRLDIGAILRCQATNIDSLKPIIRLIKLDVNCK